MRKTVHFILFFTLITTAVHAQQIEEVYFTNLPVTEDDQIGIGAKMFFTASHCSTDTWQSHIDSAGNLRVTVDYSVGITAQPCTLTDTVYINPVPQGEYTLIYKAVSVSGTFQDYDTLSLTVDVGTGLERVEGPNEGVELFPNPTTGKLQIRLTGDFSNPDAVYLRDLSGAIVKSYRSNAREIDMTDLPAGMYFVSVITAEKSVTKKVVLK